MIIIPFAVFPERRKKDGDNLRNWFLLPLANTTANDLLERETKVFGEESINAWIYCTSSKTKRPNM
jgi:hypothetical protein